MKLQRVIRIVLGISPLAMGLASQAQETIAVEEVIVTAEKREDNVQDVPIAVTALTADDLLAQRIDFGAELTRAVPNLFFSRLLAGEYNFQIRGIGAQLVAASADTGVGVHSNGVPLSVNRVADAEFFDLERIEVLRGPQGTLYGRNATGGVINVITSKPKLEETSGALNLEYGEYQTRKMNGYLNLPVTKNSALRLAGVWLQRDGYTDNLLGGDIDGRDLYSARVSYSVEPSAGLRATLLYERYDEDDDRTGGLREFCIKDPGPTNLGGVPTGATQNLLSRGCLQGSVYDPAAFGSVNSGATVGGQFGIISGLISGDAFAGVTQSRNLREVAEPLPASTEVVNELYQLNLEWNLTEKLLLTSLSSYNTDDLLATRSENVSYVAGGTFNSVPGLAPGGIYNDPQIGPSNRLLSLNIQNNESRQRTTELRLQSSFEGPLNFNVGGIYINLDTRNQVFVIPNTSNATTQVANLLNDSGMSLLPFCNPTDCYIDPLRFPDGTGHNYFVGLVPYELTAKALFGEIYYDWNDEYRLTTGLRYTDDKKEILLNPSNALLPGRGSSPNGTLEQEARFKEVTGRANLAWRPTENNLVYVSYSKGYKGGGSNNPTSLSSSSTSFDPEFVNAFEIGSKNTFAAGRLQLNATGFFYDYDGYQISSRLGVIAVTENIDAEVRGLELEAIWKPTAALRLSTAVGVLDTEITSGSSLDLFDRIQGQSGVSLVRGGAADACVAPTANLAALVAAINASPSDVLTPASLLGICLGTFASTNPANPLAGLGISIDPSPGTEVDLRGRELPQSPELTATVSAQYVWQISSDWELAVRGDYYYQADSFTRIYNTVSDELRSYDNANIAVTGDNKALGLTVQLYVKNLMDDDVITGYNTNSEGFGSTRTAMLLDPRIVGILISKQF